MMNIKMADDEQTEFAGITRRQLRIAAASADLDERTALKALAGFPVRNRGRERLLRALKAIDADTSHVPEAFQTGAADLSDTHGGRR